MGSILEQILQGAMPTAHMDAAGWKNRVTIFPSGNIARNVPRYPPAVTCKHRPLKSAASDSGNNEDIPVWAYVVGQDPSRFDDVRCRVYEDNYNQYKVVESFQFGRVTTSRFARPVVAPGMESKVATSESREFKPEVLVIAEGRKILLPLTEDFRVLSFQTNVSKAGNAVAAEESSLFPLATTYDQATVHAFVYDVVALADAVDSPDGPPIEEANRLNPRVEPMDVTDPDGCAKLLQEIDLFVTEGNGTAGLGPSVESGNSGPQNNSGGRGGSDSNRGSATPKLDDELWHPIDEDKVFTQTERPPTALMAIPLRILVLISLTPCRERADYTPLVPELGGAAGSARIYPQLMVKATFKLDHIEAALRVERPTETFITEGGPCGCGEMGKQMRSLLMTDLNAKDIDAPAPFTTWDQMFAYYTADPCGSHMRYPIDLVRPHETAHATTSKPRQISGVDRGIAELHEGGFLPLIGKRSQVWKAPFQGAFDNLHMAPHMKLPAQITKYRRASVFAGPVPQALGLNDTYLQAIKIEKNTNINFDALENGDEEIVMAPICAHDCFHTHWRWSDKAPDKHVHGWSEAGPYQVAGAPLVPLHHGVQLWMDAENVALIAEGTVRICNEKATGNQPNLENKIRTDKWEVFFYQGFAFGTGASTKTLWANRNAQDAAILGAFIDNEGNEVEGSSSWSVFYFHNRYGFTVLDLPGSEVTVYERVRANDLANLMKG